MTTVLIFAGIPLAVIALVAMLAFAGSARRTARYRPGRPFPFTSVWFVSAPRAGGSSADKPARTALTTGKNQAALLRPAAKKGGARGTW